MTILQSERLLKVPHIVHGFTRKRSDLPESGNVSLTHGDATLARRNRETVAHQLDLPTDHLTFSYQEHGTKIHRVLPSERGAGADSPETSLPPADGLITDAPNLPLAIMVADCACLLMADRNGKAVGAFHSGWRGVDGNMAAAAVESFESEFGIQPRDLLVWISPMICGKCFEVGQDIWDRFQERWGKDFLLADPLRVNLPGLIHHQLNLAGVEETQIDSAGLCTFEETSLFSHRRQEKLNGRMMGVISIKK